MDCVYCQQYILSWFCFETLTLRISRTVLLAFLQYICFFFCWPTEEKNCGIIYELVIISIVLSTFAYFYTLLGLPVKTVSYYTIAYKTHFYYQFGPLAILNSGGLLRMCGPFNEGGNLGTICAFLYAIFDEKNTKIEKAILIVGILLSFSLAGWLLLWFIG